MTESDSFRRVAAIYDIHGNLPALQAVLKEVEISGVEAVVVGGDVVPGPMPRECLDTLLSLSIPVRFIQGNGERDATSVHNGHVPARVPERFRADIQWSATQLQPQHFAEIASWPLTMTLKIAGLGQVLFCHATPRDDNEIFTRLTPSERLKPVFQGIGSDLVVCGHTHMQFDRLLADIRVVNAGSVGMPFGAPGAYWTLLGPGVEQRQKLYDFTAANELIRATAYPRASDFDVTAFPSEDDMTRLFESVALR